MPENTKSRCYNFCPHSAFPHQPRTAHGECTVYIDIRIFRSYTRAAGGRRIGWLASEIAVQSNCSVWFTRMRRAAECRQATTFSLADAFFSLCSRAPSVGVVFLHSRRSFVSTRPRLHIPAFILRF